MSSKSMTSVDKKARASAVVTTDTAEDDASEADFNDTIAKNRALPILDPETVPARPTAFRPTDPEIRNKRLRRLADEHRAEGQKALIEASQLDLAQLLGKHAPDPGRAALLAERLTRGETLIARAARLLEYARECNEIDRSDALVFLEDANKRYTRAAEDEPNLAEKFPALVSLFDQRSSAIVDGIARTNATKKTTADVAPLPVNGQPTPVGK